ncbi:MAG: LamG-like jellyroll fold domain-containing protein [Elusimicrobiota bacterium]|jgi:hypothetical protein
MLTSLLLRTLLALLPAVPALAVGPNIYGPQVQQCDGTYATGTTTRKSSPQIKVPIQTNAGLRVGQQPASYRANAGLGLWRFNGSYTKAGGTCDSIGLTRIMSWNYKQLDPEGGVWATYGRCTYAATALVQYVDSCGPSGTGPCTGRCSDNYAETCAIALDCAGWPGVTCDALRCSNGAACNTDDIYYTGCAAGQVNSWPMPLNSGLADYPEIAPVPTAGVPVAACPATHDTMAAQPASVNLAAGKFSGALTLDGAHSVVLESTATLQLGPHYSLSAWINTASGGTILSHDDGGKYWGFGVTAGGALQRFDSRDTALPTSSKGSGLLTGTWRHVAVVRWDNDSWNYYIDGVQVGSESAVYALYFGTPFTTRAYIGSRNGATRFTGQIDDLRIWRYAMTSNEVAAEYISTLHNFSANGGTSYAYQFRGVTGTDNPAYNPVASNADVVTVYYEPPVQADITTSHKYVFIAQDTNGEVTSLPVYTVSVDKTPPSKPTLAGSAMSTSDIEWSWSTPASFCGPPEDPNAHYTLIDPSNGTSILSVLHPTFSITENYGADPPNRIHCRVLSATDLYGTSPLADGVTTYTLAAQPANLTATAISTGSTLLTWSNQNNPSYTRNELEYTATLGFGGTVVTLASINDNFNGSYRGVSGLSPGTTYYVRLRAKNGRHTDAYGTQYTDYATLYSVPTGSFTTLPPTPNLTAAAESTGSVRWDWTSVPGAWGYKIYSPTDGLLLDTPALFFTSGTLSVNTPYSLSIEAYGRYGTSGPRSAPVPIYTLAKTPTNPVVATYSTNSVTVSWDPNENGPLTYYEVVAATNADFARALSTTGVTATTAAIEDLFPLTTYYFKVRAVSGGGVATPFVPGTPLKAATYPNPAIGVSSAPAAPYTLEPDLIGVWHFDENAGTSASDGSVTANNGVLTCLAAACTSTPTFASGPPNLGSGVSFPGMTDSLVRIPANAAYNFAGDITVSAWVKPATAAQPNGAGIAAKGTGGSEDFALDLSGGRFRFIFLSNRTVSSTMTLTAGSWAHVAGVYSSAAGGTLKIYVNGALSATTAGVGLRSWTNTPVTVGSRQSVAGSFDLPFSGSVDEVRIHSYAMTDAQVLSQYRMTLPSIYTPPSNVTGVSLELPPNAFTAGQAFIFVSPDPVNEPVRPGTSLIETGLTVMPTGQRFIQGSLVEIVPIVDGTPYTGLLGSPATVYIDYPDADGDGVLDGTVPPIHASTLQAYVFEPSVLRWDPLPTTPDMANSRVAALTRHFSIFGLFGAQVYGNSLREVRIYPVPWQIRSGGRFDAPNLVFDRLPTDGVIRIYSLAGEKIVEMSFGPSGQGKAQWNGTNYVGTPVASGVYLTHIKSSTDGAERILKFVIER